MKDLFGNLVDFIQKYAKEETERELNQMEGRVKILFYLKISLRLFKMKQNCRYLMLIIRNSLKISLKKSVYLGIRRQMLLEYKLRNTIKALI